MRFTFEEVFEMAFQAANLHGLRAKVLKVNGRWIWIFTALPSRKMEMEYVNVFD